MAKGGRRGPSGVVRRCGKRGGLRGAAADAPARLGGRGAARKRTRPAGDEARVHAIRNARAARTHRCKQRALQRAFTRLYTPPGGTHLRGASSAHPRALFRYRPARGPTHPIRLRFAQSNMAQTGNRVQGFGRLPVSASLHRPARPGGAPLHRPAGQRRVSASRGSDACPRRYRGAATRVRVEIAPRRPPVSASLRRPTGPGAPNLCSGGRTPPNAPRSCSRRT